MSAFIQDLRYAFRSFSKSPKFAFGVILIFAVGIGCVTAMFKIVDNAVLRPLPFTDSRELVVIGAPVPPNEDEIEWWNQNNSFVGLCSYRSGGINLSGDSAPIRVSAAVVSGDFFSVFTISPEIGRPFMRADLGSDGNPVAILSYHLWTYYFERAPSVTGRPVKLGGTVYTIIGVMPSEFSYPGNTDIWVPKSKDSEKIILGNNEQQVLPIQLERTMIGRVRPGTDLIRVREDMKVLFSRLQEKYSQTRFGTGVQITPLNEVLVGNYQQALLSLFAAVGFVLLIAIANAVNLLLARASTRQMDIAVRLCLGAKPSRLLREILTESILITLVGGAFGLMISYWIVKMISLFGPKDIPRLTDSPLDIRMLLFALGLSLIVGVVVGIVPGVKALRVDFMMAAKNTSARSVTGSRQKVRNILVIVEVAIAFVLLIGADLSIESFSRLISISPGFNSRNVIVATFDLPQAKYFEMANSGSNYPSTEELRNNQSFQGDAVRNRLVDLNSQLLEEIRHVSGVITVGSVSQLPLATSSGRMLAVDVPGSIGNMALAYYVDGDYFSAMGIPMINGRAFSRDDTQNGQKVVIINETFSKQHWTGINPIGQTLVIEGETGSREIVGIVGDTKQTGLATAIRPQFYMPYSQPYRGKQPPLEMVLVVKSNIDIRAIALSLRQIAQSVDKDLPIFRVKTIDEVIVDSVGNYRFRSLLLSIFASVALVMALSGVYGVTTFSVISRTKEIGLRMALGAAPKHIVLMILHECAVLAGLGIIIGCGAAFGLNRLTATLLYDVSPVDPIMFLRISLLLLTVVTFACLVPALMASKLRPAAALRHE